MQVEGTRLFRVKAVAEMLDVSVSTIYRAVQAGELDAYRIGTGKGAVIRIPAQAIPVYLDECGDAAYHAYVEGGADPAAEDGGSADAGPADVVRAPRPNPLLDPTCRPSGYVPIHCTTCGEWISWCSPPAPSAPVVCSACRQGVSR